MTSEDVPNILKALVDSDCRPSILYFPRQFKAPRPSAVVMGNLLYAPTNPQPINEILEARIQRATKTKRVLKAAKAQDTSDLAWLPTPELKVGQPFSIFERGTMTVTRKYPDPRYPNAFWIHTNHPDLRSFHTRCIPKVFAVVKRQPPGEPPMLVSIGKPITEITLEDMKSGNLPTTEETAAALQNGQIKTRQWQALNDAISFHENPVLFLDTKARAGA